MKPKKSLGQNFLKDKAVLDKIISAADLSVDNAVIEIGPGEGALSKELIKRVGKLVMIEKDELLAEELAKNFQFSIFNFQSISKDAILKFKNKGAIFVGDILEINLPELISNIKYPALPTGRQISNKISDQNEKNIANKSLDTKYNLLDTKYKVVANIPYYITSPIIRLFLETKYPPTEMILMVQKEVAERICAKKGEMSILAVSVQYYAQPEILFYVDKKCFWPVPEVDSAVIKIQVTREKEQETKTDVKSFFRIVKAGFSSKRKTLGNNLSASLKIDKKTVEEKIKKAGLDPTQRAQELSVDDWKELVRYFT